MPSLRAYWTRLRTEDPAPPTTPTALRVHWARVTSQFNNPALQVHWATVTTGAALGSALRVHYAAVSVPQPSAPVIYYRSAGVWRTAALYKRLSGNWVRIV